MGSYVDAVTVDREGDHIWRQVREIIAGRITDGAYPVGRLLPSARYLADELGVSVGSVKHATSVLADEGVLETRIGRGLLVVRKPDQP